MEATGKLIRVLDPITGNGANGQWKKQSFVIETPGTYPKKACFVVWGDKVDFNTIPVGSSVRVFFDIESREYNNNWYTDLKVWKVEQETTANEVQAMPRYNSQPAAFNQAPMPTESPFSSDNSEDDDLPF